MIAAFTPLGDNVDLVRSGEVHCDVQVAAAQNSWGDLPLSSIP